MIKLNDEEIIPTKFPDKTQQVYNLDDALFSPLSVVTWNYENDGEFIALAQLVMLMRAKGVRAIQLDMPYLPYARQDKPICNEFTFGLYTFAKLINSLELDVVRFYDAHSNLATNLIERSVNIPAKHIQAILNDNIYDTLAYPDIGASDRYINPEKTDINILWGRKKRDLQGNIVSYELQEYLQKKKPNNILVLDDLIDGGATFIKLIELIKQKYGNEVNVDLVVSHVVQQKAIDKLKEAGYNTIRDQYGYL